MKYSEYNEFENNHNDEEMGDHVNYENREQHNMEEKGRRHGHRCPDCPYEEPRCGQCERRGGRRHRGEEERAADCRFDEQDRPEGQEHPEGHRRPEEARRMPQNALSKLSFCGRLAEQRRGMKRGQMHILRILEENGSMSQRVLQELLRIQPGSMSEIAAKLETAGLILRERSEEDKRRVTVSISEKGRETLAGQPDQPENNSLDPLTEEEQKTLEALLDKLIEAWGAEAHHGRRGRGFGPGSWGPGRGPGHGPDGRGPGRRPPFNPKPELL